jgi:type IX secretion system PorP/SprF family membrane protein
MKDLRIHIVLAFIASLGCLLEGSAQDTQFSQVFTNPLYLNPAFAGDTHQDRASFTHRRQWTQLDAGYVSYSLGYDHNYDEKDLGIGFSLVNDRAGIHALQLTEFKTAIAKEFWLNRNNKIRVGLEGGISNRSYDRDKLLFWNELRAGGELENPTRLPYDNANYFDTGFGLVYYSNRFWSGVNISHLNKPEHSFLNGTEILNRTYSLHMGMEIPLGAMDRGVSNTALHPVIHYKTQGQWNQLDVGAYLQSGDLRFGTWYRGLPISKTADYRNVDGLIFLVGAKLRGQFQIGYSYDITLSNLTMQSGGSHEISFVFEWPYAPKKERDQFIPCPRF